MIIRKNFPILEEALSCVSFQLDYGYLLKKLAKHLHGEFLLTAKDGEKDEAERFLTLLQFSWSSLFSETEYQNIFKIQTNLRKPTNLPLESDIKTLRDYTVSSIKELTEDEFIFIGRSGYTLLRDLVVCRLTLFNARRVGEPSRLQIREWNDALNDMWLNEAENIDNELDRLLVGHFKIAYQQGKGGKLLPVLITDDCWKALKILTYPEVRKTSRCAC